MRIANKSIFCLLLLAGISLSQNMQDSLIAHYPFNGNAEDMSGFGNHGEVYGATLTEDRNGNLNSAYYFDGQDDYIIVKDNDILTPANQNLTIAVWVKFFSAANRFIIYKGSSIVNREYYLGITTDLLASFGINNYGGGLGSDQSGIPSESRLEDSTWYHIAGSWDGELQKIYINGSLENFKISQVYIGNYDSDLFIGSYGGDINRYALDAIIDDIMIFNRALSAEEISQLYTEDISVDFTADLTCGKSPLAVRFFDQSTSIDPLRKIKSWQWDFENDGIIDSDEQNPEWIYSDPGLYTVKLIVSDSINQKTMTKADFIAVLSDEPIISSVDDIPHDQGGWVKLNFFRSVFDTDSLLKKKYSVEMYTVEINDGSGWTAATSLVAYGSSLYSVLVPTTKNATSEDDGLINFRVIAGMEEGNFVSEVISGYSIDNLNPSIPQGLNVYLSGSNIVELNWEKSGDEDFRYFTLYRNIENNFDFNSLPLCQTTNNSFIDSNLDAGKTYYYTLKATDNAGNSSAYSEVVFRQITSLNDNTVRVPQKFYIRQNYPNPFNPSTIISYGIAKSSLVKITIFDVTGKEVRKLIDAKQSAGRYDIRWDGLNNSGYSVSSGIYLYEIEAGNFRRVNKMVLTR